MAGPDRSWTIAPTVAWFVAVVAAGVWVVDGDLGALADRLTHRREPPLTGAAGPAFAAPAATAVTLAAAEPPPPPPLPPAPVAAGARPHHGALEDTCIAGAPPHCTRWAMDGFYGAFAASEGGTLGRPLRASWYGDSVVATDQIPGRLRGRLQQLLGDGGPGFIYIVPPHRFCGHEAIRRAAGDGWTARAVSAQLAADRFYGPGAASAETISGRASIDLVRGQVTTAELYYLAQPRGGGVRLTADRAEIARADTSADQVRPGYARAEIAGGATQFAVEATGRVRLFGLALENATGAVVDNFGIVSVNAKNFAAQDVAHQTAQLAHRGADLVLIMIGANEAVWLRPGERSMRDYQAAYERMLAPLRGARPEASCLVVSPLDQAEVVDGAYRSKPVLAGIVGAQRRAARALGCAFYATYDWAGGAGSAVAWYRRGLLGGDLIHPSKKGAARLADAIYDALLAGARAHAP